MQSEIVAGSAAFTKAETGSDDIRGYRSQSEASERRSQVATDSHVPGHGDQGNRDRENSFDGSPAGKLRIARRLPHLQSVPRLGCFKTFEIETI